MEFIIIAVLVLVAILAVSRAENADFPPFSTESEYRRFGRYGEEKAAEMIQSVLRDEDLLFTNVEISYGDKKAELDNVIVNRYGVFIIEVKNYKGRLYGTEDDYEWKKYKEDGYGNIFEKSVKNPIKQVKRQIYILARYLEYNSAQVWVEGYALLICGNSPVESANILSDSVDIDRAIHTPGRNRLSKRDIEVITKMIA